MKKKIRKLLIVITVIVSSAFFLAYDDPDDFELIKNLEIYNNVIRTLKYYYVDEIDINHLVKVSIDAMLRELDPYTRYFPESMTEDLKLNTTGKYGGIGIEIMYRDSSYIISDILDDSPAYDAGIRIGDEILEVDGNLVKNLSFDEIGYIVKGDIRQKLHVKVRRYGKSEPINFTVERRTIKIESVPYYGMIDDKTAYIKFRSFSQGSYMKFSSALNDLVLNKDAKSLIIDLRGNPGGLLLEAVKIVNLFIDKNLLVVEMRGRSSEVTRPFYTQQNAFSKNLPVVVLVDGNSASASEIVSGALQDYDRAVIIGSRTFGKGLVQEQKSLVYGSNMMLTVAKYYIPSGRCIQALDYSKHDSKLGPRKISFDEMRRFTTKNGRIVYDAGGILPDSVVLKPKKPDLIKYLQKKYFFFDFATRYFYEHENYAFDDVVIGDEIFDEFKVFVKGHNFDFKTSADTAVEKLQHFIKIYDSTEQLADDIADIEKFLTSYYESLLDQYKTEILHFLDKEIKRRYDYKYSRLPDFETDNVIKTGIEIVNNPVVYRKFLNNNN